MGQLKRKTSLVSCWVLALLLGAPLVRAEPSSQDRAAAEALFNEGRALMDAKNYAQACPKFAESQRLDPAVGTLLNLAVCFEKGGQTASAWATYLDAAAAASSAGQSAREKAAKDKATALERRLCRLKIEAGALAQTHGAVVSRDGTALGRALWGTAVPVDPGMHTIEAQAPGFRSWKREVEARGEGATATVIVPALEADPMSTQRPPRAGGEGTKPVHVVQSPRGDAQRILGLGMGGLGLAGLTIGIVFGLRSNAKEEDSKAYCNAKSECEDRGIKLNEEAKSAATVATVGYVAGGTLLVTGLVLFLIAPSQDSKAAVTALPVPSVRLERSGAHISWQSTW